jgi:hypothetical protein
MINLDDIPDDSEIKPFKYTDRRIEDYSETRIRIWELQSLIVEFLRANGYPEIKIEEVHQMIHEEKPFMLPNEKHALLHKMLHEYVSLVNSLPYKQEAAEEHYYPPENYRQTNNQDHV